MENLTEAQRKMLLDCIYANSILFNTGFIDIDTYLEISKKINFHIHEHGNTNQTEN